MVTVIISASILLYAWILFPVIVLALGRPKPGAKRLENESHLRDEPRGDGSGEAADGGEESGAPPFPSALSAISPFDHSTTPPLTILFSAHNEEKVIGARLANLLAVDYPRDKLAILVGLDGCTDNTEAIARQWASLDPRIRVFSRMPCQGKTAMLKWLVREALGEDSGCRRQEEEGSGREQVPRLQSPASRILDPESSIPTRHLLVFTDANTMFERDAVRRLIAPMSDPRVGGVCGKLVFEHQGATHLEGEPVPASDEPVYWDLETRLKAAESALDSCLGANGAIYAIRAVLFPATLPDNTIVDDFVIGMQVRAQGYRMIFEPAAVAHEDLPGCVRHEWRRRVRIGAGAYQALSLCRSCLAPRFGVFAWCFWSHKVLRWLTPHIMLLLLAASLWLFIRWGVGPGRGQVEWVGIVAVGLFLAGYLAHVASARAAKLINLFFYFAAMQAALFFGFLKFCRGNLSGSWERTER